MQYVVMNHMLLNWMALLYEYSHIGVYIFLIILLHLFNQMLFTLRGAGGGDCIFVVLCEQYGTMRFASFAPNL